MSKQPTTELATAERDTTLNPRQLRAAGFVPVTLYGGGSEPVSLQVRAHELWLMYTSGVRQFSLSGFVSGVRAQVQELQVDPVHLKPLSLQLKRLAAA